MGLKKGFKSLTDKVERKARGTSTQEHASDSATLASFSHEANKQGLLRRRAGRKRIDDFGERDYENLGQQDVWSAPPDKWRSRWVAAPQTTNLEQTPAQSLGGPSAYVPQGDHPSAQNSYARWNQAAQPVYGQPPSSPAPSAYSGPTVSVPPISSPSLAPQQPQQASSQAPTTDASKQDQSTNNTVSGV